MALTKPSTEILNEANVAASASTLITDCTTVDATELSQLAFEAVVDFHASATLDVRIHIRCCTTDGTTEWGQATLDLGADEDGYFDVTNPLDGSTVRKTAIVWPDGLYYRVIAENLDTGQVIESVIVNAISQTVSPT